YYSVLCFMSTLPTTINIFTFSLHDALPILHALLLHHLVGSGERRAPMPYAWRGVRLHSVGTPSRLRVRARRTAPDTWSVVYTDRSEEHTSELQSRFDIVCRLLLEKKK